MSRPFKNQRRNRSFLFAALLLLIACQTLSPSSTPTALPVPAASPLPPGSTPDVLTACRPDLQAAAMHPDEQPDWEALELGACYELQLDLRAGAAYAGTAAVHFRNQTGQVLDEIVFRLYPNAQVIYGGKLTVTKASRDGTALEPQVFLEDQTGLRLPLQPPLGKDETTVIELTFEGEPPTDFGGLPNVYGIFNYAADQEVLTLANWYPILAVWRDGSWDTWAVSGVGDAVVSDAALYVTVVTHPEGWQLASTGSVQEETSQDGGQRTRLVSGPAREFTIVASPNWVVNAAVIDGITVRHWGLPGGEERWDEALDATIDSLVIFNDRFGRYPYSELDVIAAPMMNASGVEYPGMFIMQDRLYQTDTSRPFWLGVVAAHETAHQWWYGLIGNDVLEFPWQDEGLASFSQLLYQEQHQPEWYEGTLQVFNETVDNLESQPGDTSLGQPAEAFRTRMGAYGPVVYTQGAVFFIELKEKIGDEAFYNALQSYYAENVYRQTPPEALLDAFEASCSCQLDAIYAEFGVTR